MNVFLEEKNLPRDCYSCDSYYMNSGDSYSCRKLNGQYIHCNCSDGIGNRHKDCPLKSLTEHDKQVRKQVCEEIINNLDELTGKTDIIVIPKLIELIEKGEAE